MRLFDMVEFGDIDYEEIDFLIEQRDIKNLRIDDVE